MAYSFRFILEICWKIGAIASIVVGLVSYIIFKNIYVIKSIEPVVISLTLSFIVFVIISMVINKKKLQKWWYYNKIKEYIKGGNTMAKKVKVKTHWCREV